MLRRCCKPKHCSRAKGLLSYSRHALEGAFPHRGAIPAEGNTQKDIKPQHSSSSPLAPCPAKGMRNPAQSLTPGAQAAPNAAPSCGALLRAGPQEFCHVAQIQVAPALREHPWQGWKEALLASHRIETQKESTSYPLFAFQHLFSSGFPHVPLVAAQSSADTWHRAHSRSSLGRALPVGPARMGQVVVLPWQLDAVQARGYTSQAGAGAVGPTPPESQSRGVRTQTNGTKLSATGKRIMRKSPPKATNAKGVAFPGGDVLAEDDVTGTYSAPHADVAREAEVAKTAVPEVWGRVHSIESFSAVDGPGIRSVVFTQGCLRKCVFCSNPDTWSSLAKCQRMSSKQIAARLRRNKGYYEGGGGVTISGGEAMMQPQFCGAIFKEAHALGITTCIDTAGYGRGTDWAEVLPYTDLVMLCTKAMNPRLYFDMCGIKQSVMLDFAKAVADYNVPLVIRFVLVPGMTDTKEEMEALVKWAKAQPTLVRVDMLPYHRLGVNKWEELGMKYPLEGMEPPPKETVQYWKSYMQEEGISVIA